MHHSNFILTNRFLRLILLFITVFFAGLLFATMPLSGSANEADKTYAPYPHIEIITNHGKVYLELNGIRAPISTRNFIEYVESGHYNNTIFHRVIPGFVAQGGGHDENFSERKTRAPIFNESGNGLSNISGTIAMARNNDPHSATSQFYINLVDNPKLDPRPDRWGYTVFGEVLYGMQTIQEVADKPTGSGGSYKKDVPIKPFIVKSMRVMEVTEEIPMEVFKPEDYIDEPDLENKPDKSKPTETSPTDTAKNRLKVKDPT